ncbi:MAG: flippase [Syntrophorhabdaceae bacterium]|nr:flippase [Syntrophorhabdaceae bacterium]
MGLAKKIAKGTLFSLITTLTKWLRAIVISVIVARILGPGDYGVYTLVIWVLLISGTFVNLGFTTTTAKYISEYRGKSDEGSVVSIIKFVLGLQALLGIAVTLIVFISSRSIASVLSEPGNWYFFAIASIGIIPAAIFDIFSYIFTGFQNFKNLAIITFVTSLLAVISIPTALFLGYGIKGLIIVNIAISCIGLLIAVYLLDKEVPFRAILREKIAGGLKRRILRYNVYIIGIIVFDLIVNQRTEIFFLGHFRTSEEVAFYSVAFGIATAAMSILPGSLTNVLLPVISEAYGKEDRSRLNRLFIESTRYLMILAVPICVGGMLLSAHIIYLIYGASYLPAGPALALLLVSSCAMVVGTGASSLQYGIERQDFVLKLGLLLAAVNITLDLLLIPKYGVMGAVAANSTAQISGIVISQVFTCKLLKTRWPFKDFTRILAASLAMAPFVLGPVFLLGGNIGPFVSVVLGSFAYLIAIVLFRVIEEKDVILLEGLGNNVPPAFRGMYSLALRFAKRHT